MALVNFIRYFGFYESFLGDIGTLLEHHNLFPFTFGSEVDFVLENVAEKDTDFMSSCTGIFSRVYRVWY